MKNRMYNIMLIIGGTAIFIGNFILGVRAIETFPLIGIMLIFISCMWIGVISYALRGLMLKK